MGYPGWIPYGWIIKHLGVSLPEFSAHFVFTKHSVRALGETDLNPVSGLGKISQLVFALIQPGNVVANIIAGGA